jgi:hypothetical protein
MDELQQGEEEEEIIQEKKKIPQKEQDPLAMTVKPLRLPTVTMAGPPKLVSPRKVQGKLVMPAVGVNAPPQGKVVVSPKPSVPKPVVVAPATMGNAVVEPPLESSLLTTTISESSKLQPPVVAQSTSSEREEQSSISAAAPEQQPAKEVMDKSASASTSAIEPVIIETTMPPGEQGGEDQQALELAWQKHLEKQNSNSQGSISNDDDEDDAERPHKTPKEPHMDQPPVPPHMDHDEDEDDARGSSQKHLDAQEQVLSQMDRHLSPPQTPPRTQALQLDLHSSSTRPPVVDSSSVSASASANEAAVPEHVLEQFSKQLKRLEENHQAERAVMEQELQGHIQQALEKQRQEMAGQSQKTQHQLQHDMERQFDEKRGEWNRQKEGYTLRLDSLTRERDGTQELLEESQKEKRRMQDDQLKELRNMEKQMNVMEAEKDKHAARVKELEVSMDWIGL